MTDPTHHPLTEEDLREVREQLRTIEAATDRLRTLGEDVPAIERNAARIEGTLAMLEAGAPPELLEDDAE